MEKAGSSSVLSATMPSRKNFTRGGMLTITVGPYSISSTAHVGMTKGCISAEIPRLKRFTLSVCIASENNCLSDRIPNCVCTYLFRLFTTREMVETSSP